MTHLRVLVLGGYGLFGGRLVERLARLPGLQIQVAGRSLVSARAFVQQLQGRSSCRLEPCALDTHAASFEDSLRTLDPHVLVNASGPFQPSDYRVPGACIAAGIHYVDLADNREFVTGIVRLHQDAVAGGVCVIAGASSVPALSGAAADALTQGLSVVHAIDIGISPANAPSEACPRCAAFWPAAANPCLLALALALAPVLASRLSHGPALARTPIRPRWAGDCCRRATYQTWRSFRIGMQAIRVCASARALNSGSCTGESISWPG